MSSSAFLYRMPSGIPGMVSRQENQTVEPVPYDPARPFTAFGEFGKVVGGKFAPIATGDTADAIYGMAIKAYPSQASQEPIGVAVPPRNGVANVLRRGYVTVLLRAGTAALNSPVYVRVDNPTAGKPIGGIEAVADGANTIQVGRCTFMSGADAAGNVEISYNI